MFKIKEPSESEKKKALTRIGQRKNVFESVIISLDSSDETFKERVTLFVNMT